MPRFWEIVNSVQFSWVQCRFLGTLGSNSKLPPSLSSRSPSSGAVFSATPSHSHLWRRQWQVDRKRRTFTWRRINKDPTLTHLQNLIHNRQPQPCS